MNKSIRIIIAVCQGVVLAAAGISLSACGGKSNPMAMNNMVKEYAVIQVEPAEASLNTLYPATIRGRQDVEIRSKVNGFITKVCVDEGAAVRKGQALFLIDRIQYEEAVAAAEAAVKVAEANVATSQLTVDTKTELAARNIISQFDLQTAQNDLQSRKAALAQTKAQLTSARNDLSYTTITSPSDGYVGTIPFRVGSLVGTSTATPLTTVSDISEMFVYFSVNEKELLDLIRKGGSVSEILKSMPAVQLRLADGSIYPENGKIETVSGVIDKTTGAATMRATFPNKNNVLRSGGSGNVLFPVKMDSVLMIPQKATYELQDKKFVYVLTDSSTVKNTPIEVLAQSDGQNYVVLDGLKPGDRVVVEGITSLRDNMKIKAITPQEAAAKVSAQTGTGAQRPAAK